MSHMKEKERDDIDNFFWCHCLPEKSRIDGGLHSDFFSTTLPLYIRVARWCIFIPKIPILVYLREPRIANVGIFNVPLVYCTTIYNI
jgi:hypothetical protein